MVENEALEPVCLYFMKEHNAFVDEGGYMVLNPFDYITPNDLLFMDKKEACAFINNRGELVELFYPEDEED